MIDVKHLVKEYRVRKSGGIKGLFTPDTKVIRAVDDVTFHVRPGEMVGYIGPNGAGKSTTIKLLTSILTPTAGTISIDGKDPQADRKSFVRGIGAMFGQKTQLWWDLPLQDSYLLLKDIYEIDEATYNENMALCRAVLELDDFIRQPVRQLSLGQRVRGDLAAVLLHNPKVVFLDEPTLGVDFVVKRRIREFLKEICQKRGTTLLLTSHDIADIESLCARIVVINRGRIAYDGALDSLRADYGGQRLLTVEFAREYADFSLAEATFKSSEGNKKTFAFAGHVSPSRLIGAISQNYEIANLTIDDPSIEDIISEIYRRGSEA